MSFPTPDAARTDKIKKAPHDAGYVYRNAVTGRWDWCLDMSPFAPFVRGEKTSTNPEKWQPVDVERLPGASRPGPSKAAPKAKRLPRPPEEPPSPAQRRVLENAEAGRPLNYGLRGRSEHGAHEAVRLSLRRRGWLDRQDKITPAGRSAINRKPIVSGVSLSDRMRVLLLDGPLARDALAKPLGIPQEQARNVLSSLLTKKHVRRVGVSRRNRTVSPFGYSAPPTTGIYGLTNLGRELAERVKPAVDALNALPDYHHICETLPACLCSGPGAEDCSCLPRDRMQRMTSCVGCGAGMAAIDMETGEQLAENRSSSFEAT